MFETKREREFYNYGEDMEFVRYHKRTTRNFHRELQALITSSKQTIAKGIKGQYSISIEQVRLNRACTVANVFWALNILAPELVPEQFRRVQAMGEKDYLESERRLRTAELEK